MDFNKCVEILQERAAHPPTLAAPVPIPTVPTEIPSDIHVDENFNKLLSIDLIKKFHELQTERIKTYRYFDEQLSEVITGNYPARYPLICEEVTKKFQNISTIINSLKNILLQRKLTDLVECINKIQNAEKDKLMLVAAHHLDQLKSTVLQGTEHITGSKTETQMKYLSQQIETCQNMISEIMEEIQCCICDIVEEEGETPSL